MTTFRIILRCRRDQEAEIVRNYRIEAWTREEAIRKAKDLAFNEGFGSTSVNYCMPAWTDEISK
jgi:hypothetical protein